MSQIDNKARASYRVSQYWTALRNAQLNKSDLELIGSMLNDAQLDIFNRMQNSEKVHALRVLQTLLDAGESHPDLLTAALLHDVGKIAHPLRLWERVFIVLGKKFLPKLSEKWSQAHLRGLKRPFIIEKKHPGWGAEQVQRTGASSLAITLIKEHHSDPEKFTLNTLLKNLLTSLQNADNQN